MPLQKQLIQNLLQELLRLLKSDFLEKFGINRNHLKSATKNVTYEYSRFCFCSIHFDEMVYVMRVKVLIAVHPYLI